MASTLATRTTKTTVAFRKAMSQNSTAGGGSAPMLGVLRPQIYRFMLGSFGPSLLPQQFRNAFMDGALRVIDGV